MQSKLDPPKSLQREAFDAQQPGKDAGLTARVPATLGFIGTNTLLRICLIAIALSIFYTWFSAPMAPRHFMDVRVTATGTMTSAQAKGAQVWLMSPKMKDLRNRNADVRTGQGWRLQNGDILYFQGDSPAPLSISGYFSQQDALIFLKHPWSGEAVVHINGISRSLDLYHPGEDYFYLALGDYRPPETSSFNTGIFLEDAIRAGKYFLITFPLLILFFPVYRWIPETVGRRSKSLTVDGAESAKALLRKNHFPLRAVALGAFLLLLNAFYPGVMTDDSYSQYREVIQSKYQDWHPPAMAAVWTITDKIITGSGGMYLLHLAFAVYSVYLLSRVAQENRKRFYALPILLLFLPPVSGILFVIWKDVSLATSFLLAFSLWYYLKTTDRLTRSRGLAVLCLLFYGACVRHNGLIAVLPFLFLFFYETGSIKKATALSLLFFGFFYLGWWTLNYHLLRSEKSYISQTIMADDLMAIYDSTTKNYFPSKYLTDSQLTEVMKDFNPALIHGAHAPTPFITSDASTVSDLRRNWLLAIQEQSGAYLQHRWFKFKDFLTAVTWVHQPISYKPPSDLADTRNLKHETSLGRLHTVILKWMEYKMRPLFQPASYILLNCLIAILAIRKRIFPAAALSLSSLFYVLPYFFVAPRSNYRFIYWSVIATYVSVIVFWIENSGTLSGILRRRTNIYS